VVTENACQHAPQRRTAPTTVALSVGGALVASPAAAEDAFVELFDGRSTAGWVQRGGKAVYAVEDGALVGRTVLGEKNSFLCPPKEYADFVLEFEVLVDPKLNSGVQIRSASGPDYKAGAVHGYQVEIDPSERGWSGGNYEEQRRGWLTSRPDDPAAQQAFQARRVEPLPGGCKRRSPAQLGERHGDRASTPTSGRCSASATSTS
jgi:hypothetical protein